MQDRVGDVWATSDNIFRVSFDTSMTYFSTINNLHGFVSAIKRINGKLYVKTNQDLYDFEPSTSLNEQSVLSLQNFPNNIFIVKVFRGELEEQSFKILKSN